jgi:hypothetical protein
MNIKPNASRAYDSGICNLQSAIRLFHKLREQRRRSYATFPEHSDTRGRWFSTISFFRRATGGAGEKATGVHPQTSSCQPAKDRGDKSGMGTPRSTETRNEIHACMALQWNKTKDETVLDMRFRRRHQDRRPLGWLPPDDRKWLCFPDRCHKSVSLS